MTTPRRPMTRSAFRALRRGAIAALAASAVVASAALPHASADARPRRTAEIDVTRIVALTDLVREATDIAHGTSLPATADRAVHTCPLPRVEPCSPTPPSLAQHADRVLDGIAAWLNFVERLREFLDSVAARV